MRILHTADWHLGKRLDDFSRLPEQVMVLNEICEIADREDVDAAVEWLSEKTEALVELTVVSDTYLIGEDRRRLFEVIRGLFRLYLKSLMMIYCQRRVNQPLISRRIYRSSSGSTSFISRGRS